MAIDDIPKDLQQQIV